jgi:hypothetical protein
MAEKGNKYSVYQGLDSDPQINWGTVATTISKQLKSLRDLKVAERDAIDKATQDQMDQLNKLPDVNDRSLNKIIMEASDNSKQYLFREAALVKRGLRKPKDYSLFLQSQKNGYSEFGNVVKNWDKWNQAKMDAIASGDQSALDALTAEDIASFGNLKDKTIMTNPANGQLQVVSMGKDKNGNYTVMPNALKNPGAFNNPASINSRMKFEEKKRDTSALVNKEVDFIGQHIIATRKANGVVETIEDFTTAPSYPKWKQASIDKLTSNEYHMTQILTDQGYVLGRTLEEAQEKDPTVTKENFIEVDMSGDKPVPKLTEDQEKEAKKIVGDLIDSQITRKENETQGFDTRGDDKEKEDRGISFDIAYAVTSGGKPSSAAIEKIKANNDTISNIYKDPTTNEFVIQYSDGSSPKRIKPATKLDKNGKEVYDAKESAVSLMAAVTPGGDVVTAEKARDEYKGGDKPYSDEFNTDRIKVTPSNASTGFMNTTKTVNGKIVPVSIADEMATITDDDYDEDSSAKFQNLLQGLGVEEGTENLVNNIKVYPSPRWTENDEVIRIDLPPEVMLLIDKTDTIFGSDTEQGDNFVEINLEPGLGSEDKNRAAVKYIINKILQASADQYNGVTGTSSSNSSDDINTSGYNKQ